MSDPGMVIVGAGEAGARAAFELRAQGWEGKITLIGEEKWAPYERPPLSKDALLGQKVSSPVFIMDLAKLQHHQIDFISDSAVIWIDRDAQLVELANGKSIRYVKLLLATGARPRRLSIDGVEPSGLGYLRTYDDAIKLSDKLQPGQRIAIIGAGFIGLEVAASAIGRGCSVTVIEVGSRILMRGVPVEIACIVEERHREAGVEFQFGVGISAITSSDSESVVVLEDGTTIVCDHIVAGIGAIPETNLAAACGLAVENGIRVNECLTTSDPNIFAAGDCCSFQHPFYGGNTIRLEAWRNAQDQGTHAAQSMLGQVKPFACIPWFWSDQYDLTLQVTGLTDYGSRIVQRYMGEATLLNFHLTEEGRLVAVSGIGAATSIAKDIRFGEMLIEQQAMPDPASLANPNVKLKTLLHA